MAKNLAVYIDESGNFDFTKQGSKFYVLSFVFAESSVDYTSIFKSVKYPKFHAVPIIKGLGDFESLNTIERRKIFRNFATCVEIAPITYKCFFLEKKDFKDKDALIQKLVKEMHAFMMDPNNNFEKYESITFYYDDGQDEISASLKILLSICYSNSNLINVEEKNRMFEIADYVSEIALLKYKLRHGILTRYEKNFFTSKELRSNYIRPFMKKIIQRKLF